METETSIQSASNDGFQAQNAYMAQICHEIRTPLTAILGVAQLMKNTKLPADKQAQCVNALQDSATMLKELIDDMLDCSRMEAGMMKLECIPFDLVDAIFSATHIMMPRAAEKNIQLNVSAISLPKYVLGDSLRFEQIILNLLSNAIKFTSEGVITLEASAKPAKNSGWDIRVSVKDTGIGIAPDKLERIFDRYAQAEDSTSRKYRGTGLGLTISRNLAHMMGGDIKVKSELGKGSEFIATMQLGDIIEKTKEV